MQTKPEDRPKIIGLIAAIVLLLIVAFVRLLPALTAKGPDTTAAVTTPAGTAASPAGSMTPASATSANLASAAPGNPGQMRRFDDTMDTDAPVGANGVFGNAHTDAFRVIEAPKKVAVTPPPSQTAIPNNSRPPLTGFPYQPTIIAPPTIQMVAAPPLQVVLDGVYQAGQERVAQLTILPKDAVKDASGKGGSSLGEQTVYRRVGEYIGRFKITRLTENGLALAGQQHSWSVGETAKLDQGLIPAPQATAAAPPSRALPILLPR